MARAISDEELQLKRRARRRLIGAIVLVTAIVVVLPMVLDSEPRPASQAVSVQIPSPDSGAFATGAAPLPAGPDAVAASKATDVKPAPEPPSNTAKKITAAPPAPQPAVPVKETAKPADAGPAAVPARPPVKKAKPADKPGGKYVVQVIALADAAKAQQMQGKIAAAGIPSYTEVVKTAKGDVTRVRAGPFASRADAEKTREQLKALGMNGNVITR